ncbi:CPBP family intramembrane glutamic endopeptidase [Nonomuraea sp. NPDC050663]|uniref:CPBP family intramembrane glutamic endopeptidase n=1 Tax=Nonomuraea sp. NPDC050663 TaxID=3364370 RepID=UPI0037AF36A3
MPKRDIIVFLAVSFGLSWLVALPLWLGDGLESSQFLLWGSLLMLTPTLGVLAVWLTRRTPFRHFAAETGLTIGPAQGRTARLILAAWLGIPAIILISIALSLLLGWLQPDLSGLATTLRSAGLPVPADLTPAFIAQVAGATLIGPVVNAVQSFGEEWGWRGWLLPRLVAERGVLFGVLVSGVIWGAWHAPLTLLGYNYPDLGAWAALMFVGATVLIGALFGWLRLRSGSVWPAVVAHGSLNAVGPVVLVFGGSPNAALVGVAGVAGWVVLAVVTAVLFRAFPVRQAQVTGA